MHHRDVEEKRRNRCRFYMGIRQNGLCLGLASRKKHLTTSPKPVPINAKFSDLRNLLAIEGGKLLVSVIRDMIGDKVAWYAFPESYSSHWRPILGYSCASNFGWRGSICTYDFYRGCPRQFYHNVSRYHHTGGIFHVMFLWHDLSSCLLYVSCTSPVRDRAHQND